MRLMPLWVKVEQSALLGTLRFTHAGMEEQMGPTPASQSGTAESQ
jgi:hypothetical protein